MIALDVADLVVIIGRALGIGSDAALSQLDVAAAQAALAEARLASSVIADQDTAAAAGIGLVHALLRHRPFPRHGEQIAVAAGLQFLSLNGWRADLDPPASAAVVIEALADGQLSPASAAAWLSPRLAAGTRLIAGAPARSLRSPRPLPAAMLASPAPARCGRAVMRDASAPRREPSRPAPGSGRRKPPSVIYPQVLLFVQAAFWALGTACGLILHAAALAHGAAVEAAPAAAGWPAITGGLAAAKLMLGRRLDRSRSKRAWRAAIVTELAMTGFGVLWLAIPAHGLTIPGLSGAALSPAIPAYGLIIPGLSGAALSLAAVLCMIRPRARHYFTGPDAVPGTPDPGAPPDPASFWPLAPASRYLATT